MMTLYRNSASCREVPALNLTSAGTLPTQRAYGPEPGDLDDHKRSATLLIEQMEFILRGIPRTPRSHQGFSMTNAPARRTISNPAEESLPFFREGQSAYVAGRRCMES